ncbi:MAG: hypothetical protein IKZ49_02350 [Alphaproteobacteria bacterium]|nr:hypothetical protein [Alphaproteobacteria bacterium]
MTKTERIENIVKKLKTRKSKAILYTIFIAFVVICFGYRFYLINQEQNTNVFNIARNNIEYGLPVETLKIEKKDGILYEPLNIKNNRAYVSSGRINLFKTNQKIGDGKIISVSKNIDLDSGMYVIKTKSCKNGLQYVEIVANGFYVPVSAIKGNNVYVVNGDVAEIREIVIGGRDSQNAFVKKGLSEGDVVILSDVKDNQKIKIVK